MRFREPCMCGALDCVACRGPGAVADFHAEEEWADTEAHYVQTLSHSRTHVARKEHAAGTIQPGDTYRRSVTGGYISACEEYPEGGPRWMTVSKRLLIKKVDAVRDQEFPV
jgi:hypothetical protein